MVVNRKFLQNRLKKQRARSKGGMSFFKLKEGKNCLRILPFRHKFNKFDLAAGRCDEEHVDQAITLMFLDVTRPFGQGIINCLEDDELCPVWQEYYDTPKEDKTRNKPKPQYFVNLIDLDEPNKGVQIVGLTPSVFMGERNSSGERRGLGIIDYYEGYTPDDEDQREDENTDKEDVEGGGGTAKFRKIKAIGDALLGLNGRDILVYAYKKGRNIRLDHSREMGAVVIRMKSKCDELANKWNKGIQDLYMLEWLFPGYSSKGREKCLNSLAGDFIDWREDQKDGDKKDDPESDPDQGQGVDPDQNGDPDQQDDSKPKKKKKKVTKKKPGRKKKDPVAIDRGSKVRCIDKMNDDNTMTLPEDEWTEFVGIFERYDKKDGETVGYAHLDPNDQEDDETKEYLEEIQEDADTSKGGPFYAFPVDCITSF